jgi:hypothetical protein
VREEIDFIQPKKIVGQLISIDVLDKIREEIEHMIPCSKEALSMKLGALEIIDKYKAESEK